MPKSETFSGTEIEMLVGEVEVNQKLLLRSLSTGGTNKRKNTAWEQVRPAVNAVVSEDRTLLEIKR